MPLVEAALSLMAFLFYVILNSVSNARLQKYLKDGTQSRSFSAFCVYVRQPTSV